MIESASVIIRGDKAYIPTFGRTPDGLNVIIEPIYVVDLNTTEIVSALERIIAAGIRRVRDPKPEEMQRLQNLLPKAAGVKSWKALARGGEAYTIAWEPQRIRLVLSEHDAQGRFAPGAPRAKDFPKDTPLSTIVDAILEDARALAQRRESAGADKST